MFVSFVRTLILYVIIVVTIRLMGKRQVGELEPTELVAAILISDLAAVPMQDIGIPLLSGVIPILTLLALELISAELSLRSIRFRSLLCGNPVFLIKDGKIDQKAMAATKLSLDELSQCLRENGISDIDTVKFAILETSGRLSTFLYPEYAPLTTAQENAHTDLEIPLPVISDGTVLSKNLSILGWDRRWLLGELSGLSPDNVYLMTATRCGTRTIIPKENSK